MYEAALLDVTPLLVASPLIYVSLFPDLGV